MKLIELLQKLSKETLVGIWNIDDKRSSCQTPQTYQKVENIPFGKIRNIADYEVPTININEKNNGVLIRVYDEERLKMSVRNSDLAKKLNIRAEA